MSSERGVSLKAVLLGLLADIGSTIIVGTIAGVAIGIVLFAQGVALDQLEERMYEDPLFLVPSLGIGLACTMFGGFIAARIARRSEVLHGGLVGVLGTLLAIPFMGSYPLWYNVTCFLCVIPAAALGGRLGMIPQEDTPESADEPRGDGTEPGDDW